MNKNNKGPAETVKQQKKDLKKDMEGGMKKAGDVPGKKGGAKKDVMLDENMSGSGKKKGSAKHHGNMPKKKGAGQMTSAERFAKSDKASDDFSKKVYGGEKGSTNIRGKKMAGFNFMPPENPGNPEDYQKGKSGSRGSVGKPDIASYAYDANQDGDSFFNDRNQDGTMLGRGIKSAIKYFGGSRGYTQNFGPARQNSYAKGAAKVADIMGRGAAKGKGAAEYGGNKGDDSKSKKDYEG